MPESPRVITVAHSPDADDAFMFYGLATGKIRVPGLSFTIEHADIETLNHRAVSDPVYDVTAISFGAYPKLHREYAITTCGSSFGDNYGPILVATRKLGLEDLSGLTIAVPGELTTAFLTLRLFSQNVQTVNVPFNEIIPAVLAGKFDAGLLIHEGQLSYAFEGLNKLLDLGVWWKQQTSLPLPLGGNAVRRSLGPELMATVAKAVRDSILYGLEHREEALSYAGNFTRDLDPALIDQYIGMYVNNHTVDFGPAGAEAVRTLFTRAHEQGILTELPQLDFI